MLTMGNPLGMKSAMACVATITALLLTGCSVPTAPPESSLQTTPSTFAPTDQAPLFDPNEPVPMYIDTAFTSYDADDAFVEHAIPGSEYEIDGEHWVLMDVYCDPAKYKSSQLMSDGIVTYVDQPMKLEFDSRGNALVTFVKGIGYAEAGVVNGSLVFYIPEGTQNTVGAPQLSFDVDNFGVIETIEICNVIVGG